MGYIIMDQLHYRKTWLLYAVGDSEVDIKRLHALLNVLAFIASRPDTH